jgi:hypothetical protein
LQNFLETIRVISGEKLSIIALFLSFVIFVLCFTTYKIIGYQYTNETQELYKTCVGSMNVDNPLRADCVKILANGAVDTNVE